MSWLPLAMLACSIGVVAFVLPLGIVGSPQGPLDVSVAMVRATLLCSSSPAIIIVSPQLPCLLHNSFSLHPPRTSSSIVVVHCCRPPLSLVMLPPPSVSAIVRWLPLATLACSVSIVAFVLPLGIAGSPQGPLDIGVAMARTTSLCSSSPTIILVSPQLPCLPHHSFLLRPPWTSSSVDC